MKYTDGSEIMRSKPFATILMEYNSLPFYCDWCWNNCEQGPKKRRFRCKECKIYYYCNEKCQKEAWFAYHKKECKYLRKSPSEEWISSVENRLVLRVLARIRNGGEEAFEELPDGRLVYFRDLQTNTEEVIANEELYTVFNRILRNLRDMMKSKCPSEQELLEIYGRIVTNSHQPYINPQASYLGIFLCGSKVDHSCEPNAIWELDGNMQVFKTITDVESFEDIRISYLTNMNLDLPQDQRQILLRERFLFDCTCFKCANTDL